VNMALNSLTGELLESTVACLCFGGVLLELGKKDVKGSVLEQLRLGDKGIMMIDLDQVMAHESTFEVVRRHLSDGLRTEEVVPLPRTIFVAPGEIGKAFECMSSRERIGKVVVQISHDSLKPDVPSLAATMPTRQGAKAQAIVIVGGLGGLGLCLAQWITCHFGPACKVILCGRGGTYKSERARVLRYLGSRVEVREEDFSQYGEVTRLLERLRSEEDPVSLVGFFNAAASLNDVAFEKMSTEAWETPFASKVDVTQNFVRAVDAPEFEDVCRDLQYFVCFSSVVAGLGNASQTNYACANAAMEQLVIKRAAGGKPGLCVRLGLVPHVGLATSVFNAADTNHLRPIPLHRVLLQLERLIASNASGLFALYSEGILANSSSPFAQGNLLTPAGVQAELLRTIRDQLDCSASDEELLNMPIGQMPGDSLVITQILNSVRAKVDSEWISAQIIAELTPLVLANKIAHVEPANLLAIATVPSAHIITVATIPSLTGDSEMKAHAFRALMSIKSQSRPPDMTVLVFEDTRDHTDEALVAELKQILPHAKLVVNERTRGFYGFSSSGALNTGMIASANDEKVNDDSWISILDTATSIWRPTHLQKCLSMVEGADNNSCQWVMAASWNQAGVLPRAGERTFFVAHVEKSCFFVRRNLMMEAGMFDEALCSRAATDLYVRLFDVLAGENLAQPISSAEVTESTVDSSTSEAASQSKCDIFDDFDHFLYKHNPRMTSEQLELALSKRAISVTVRPMQETSSEELEREFDLVQLPMWDPQHSVAVRRDVFDTVQSGADQMATLAPKLKLLFGIITSNPERVSHLLRDLSYMLNDRKHCVVVFVNAIDLRVADEVSHLLQSQKSRFRGHVIRSNHRLVKEVLKETHGSSTNGILLPIAMSRTVLQTFLCATTKAEHFDAVAVLDDDMRLPKTWSLREGDDGAGDILNGRAIKTPPNPTVMSMRTQMLDFLFALDQMHSARDHKMCAEARAPQKIFSNLQDQYYDLSSSRWDHLEMPRQFYSNEPVNSFVKQCRKRILVGDPLAREAVSTEEGRTTQRGGCMVLFHKSFDLLLMEQMAPQVRLSSGKTVASRRSDSFWVQRHCSVHGKVSVVRRHLSVLHDNMHDKIPSTQTMRETVALEMIGAIICRPPEQRVSFSHNRVQALQCSIARIRGICKVLRSRPYFESTPELSSFVDYLETDLLNHEQWRREVFEVIERNVRTLEEWIPYAQPSVERVYALSDSEKRSFLCDGNPVFPDAAALRLDQGMAIPCLHRFHHDDEELEGAHYIQNCIGMSISLSYACDRLRQLARLSEVTAGWSTAPTRKALVTMDDGFRDVMLLRPTFRELADHLQPVLFLPSALLGGNPSLKRRQLPLVCLYEHCFRQGIDNPDDIDKLGAVRRSVLKTLSESEQYERLERAGIPTDLGTDDLLTNEDLHELASEGWWICSHGPDHSDLTRARSFQRIEQQLLFDFELIRRNGWTPWFAWPEGRWCARIADALARQRDGPTAQFGLTDALRDESSHPAVIQRVAWLGGGRAVRVLVTGSEGFLGRHLCLVLRAHGFDVFEYDFARGHDILDKENLTRELRDHKIDACVHLAAQADLYEAEKYPDAAWRTNVDGTRSVLECCNKCDVRMLFASTCCAYGNNKTNLSNEMSPTAPTELYATTKLEGEAMIISSDRTCELCHVVMRLATFYGPDMRGSLATARFLQAAATGGVINIHGTGEQTRCFTHVHDIADGIRVLLCAKDFSGIVNVADDREYSVNELARVAMSVSRPCAVVHEQDREGQIQRSKICNKRLRELGKWGWQPTVSLEDGMRDCARRLGMWPMPALIDDKFTKAAYDTIASCGLECTSLPITCGLLGQIYTTDNLMDGTQLVAYVVGDLRHKQLAVRIHSECLFGDVFGSLKCDCGAQLQIFFTCIAKERHGILVYVKGHEGRGAGLMTKTRAYRDVDQHPSKHHNDALLDAGAASIDSRCYSAAAALVVRLIREANESEHARNKGTPSCSSSSHESIHLVLHTNNRQKVEAIENAIQHCGVALPRLFCAQQTMPAESTCNPHNQKYLLEKIGNGHEGLCVARPDVVPAVFPEDISVGALLHCPSVDDVPGMATEENIDVFDAGDPKLFDFYKEHGFAVIRGLISKKEIEAALCLHESNVLRLFEKVNARIGDGQVTFDEFELGVSQFRDLFLNDARNNVFRALTCDEGPTSMSTVAQRAMDALDPEGQWTGMKLLHDHIIVKPARGASKKIPLHQDTMFWPVDIPACSTWTALTDAPVNGGCMEIVSLKTKPHQRKQNVWPVDFMNDENNSGLALLLQDDPTPKRWLLPMSAGDTLIFSSHTWHRSSVNQQSQQKRVAYIQTWVHPRAAWRPDLVPWHPVNEHLKKAGHTPGSELCGERHPRTGTSCGGLDYMNSRYARTSSITKTATKQAGSSISMFDASDIVSTQILNILALHGNIRKPASLVDALKDPTCREMLVKITCDMFYQSPEAPSSELDAELATESGCKTISELLSWTLKQILISTAAYEYDRSRNVFNSAYAAWWKLAGEQWNQRFTTGSFHSEYQLCKTDVNAFLKVIFVDREKYSRTTDGKLELLQAIICGCMEHVPFQNITMLTRVEPGRDQRHRPPTLGQIIDDMTKGLGGLCTTRNPFLSLLLKALEFEDVRFVCATMTPLAKPILEHAHIALLVRVGTIDYWVDVANGFPYMQPLALDADCSAVIKHPFVDTRLVQRTSAKGDDALWVVQHQLHTTGQEDWNDNYFFSTTPVDYATGFASMHEKHYDPEANYGPFLTHLRLNMWSMTAGVLLRDDKLTLIDGTPEANKLQTINMWDASEELSELAAMLKQCAFTVNLKITELVPEAWARCQMHQGAVQAAEKVTVTGGFFDNSADGYIGVVTVWRSQSTSNVVGLTFRMVNVYTPDMLPVINKGFAGASWYNNELYVCWPNRIAVVTPKSGWAIQSHIDNKRFNDLHHVHACSEGIWVANTGQDSVDHLTLDGELVSRTHVCCAPKSLEDTEIDLRDQSWHDKLRGHDKEHVNYVTVALGGLCEPKSPSSLPINAVVAATLLNSKQVVNIQENQATTPNELIAQLDATKPPHEGFLAAAPWDPQQYYWWNSTVDGCVVATDCVSGGALQWNLCEHSELPRGWTRGLCLLPDGFLVGSTALHAGSEEWIKKHHNTWNFDTTRSRTTVSFVPFASSETRDGATSVSTNADPKSVHFLNARHAKIFSLLITPAGVSHHE